jgi:hypothetical protein
MPAEALEEIRLLSNLESSRHKLLQIVLFGQPELDQRLRENSMRQLNDRITHHFRLAPLAPREVGVYLMFRLRAAGYRGPDLFSRRAIQLISQASEGLTRSINVLADKALLAAFSEGVHQVGRARSERRSATRNSDASPGVAVAGKLAIGRRCAGRRADRRLAYLAGRHRRESGDPAAADGAVARRCSRAPRRRRRPPSRRWRGRLQAMRDGCPGSRWRKTAHPCRTNCRHRRLVEADPGPAIISSSCWSPTPPVTRSRGFHRHATRACSTCGRCGSIVRSRAAKSGSASSTATTRRANRRTPRWRRSARSAPAAGRMCGGRQAAPRDVPPKRSCARR